MEDVKSIANYFIKKANEDNRTDLSPMKLQKLVYYAHGVYLAIEDEPLINEQIEAWKFGPVIASLYHSLKYYGMKNIKNPIPQYESLSFSLMGSFTSLDDSDNYPEIVNPLIENFLDVIWDQLKNVSAISLSNLTHQEGTPWYKIYVEANNNNPPKGTDIPSNLIKEWFKEKLDNEE